MSTSDPTPPPEDPPNRAARRAQRRGRKPQVSPGHQEFRRSGSQGQRFAAQRRSGRRGNR